MAENLNVQYAGPWADLGTVCKYLSKTPEGVVRMVENFELLGCKFNDAKVYFPVRQFADHTVVDGLGEVLRVLNTGISSPKVWSTWLAGPGPDGQQTIWDALRDGRKREVLIEAAHDAARWSR
ncbi:hypothetical protein ACLRGF_05460 [Mycetocola zhadangensis]|uniref:hypothetical protein n=1 Tax=Mycetocola zhadangensis TaxID=1164595 RepID=UPI003A4DF52D